MLIEEGALIDAKGIPVRNQRARLRQSASIEEFTFANRPFRPTDFDLFTPGTYSEAPIPEDANVSRSEDEVLQNFVEFMQRKVKSGLISDEDLQGPLIRFDSFEAR